MKKEIILTRQPIIDRLIVDLGRAYHPSPAVAHVFPTLAGKVTFNPAAAHGFLPRVEIALNPAGRPCNPKGQQGKQYWKAWRPDYGQPEPATKQPKGLAENPTLSFIGLPSQLLLLGGHRKHHQLHMAA